MPPTPHAEKVRFSGTVGNETISHKAKRTVEKQLDPCDDDGEGEDPVIVKALDTCDLVEELPKDRGLDDGICRNSILGGDDWSTAGRQSGGARTQRRDT